MDDFKKAGTNIMLHTASDFLPAFCFRRASFSGLDSGILYVAAFLPSGTGILPGGGTDRRKNGKAGCTGKRGRGKGSMVSGKRGQPWQVHNCDTL